MSLKDKRNIFRGINLLGIFGVVAIVIAPIIYVLVPNDTEEDFRSSIQSFPAISYVQSLVGLKNDNVYNNKYFTNVQSIHGFWFSMPLSWKYITIQDNNFDGDDIATYKDHMWSDKYPNSNIWFYSAPFFEKTITGPNEIQEYCSDTEEDRSNEFNKDFKFDECRLEDGIQVGYNHMYTSNAGVENPRNQFFQYTFFIRNRFIMLNASCLDKDSVECKGVEKTLYIMATNLCEGLECSASNISVSDDDMKIINEPLNTEIIASEPESHRLFGGIGIQVEKYDNLLRIVDFSDDSPALKAGMLTGDIILKVANISIDNLSTDEAIQLLRGDSGTLVSITIKRNQSVKPLVFNINRELIDFNSKQYISVMDSTKSFSLSIPDNCKIELWNANILDDSTVDKLNKNKNILSSGEKVSDLSSVMKKSQTGLIDVVNCKGMAGLWNINSTTNDPNFIINEYTYKNICSTFGELLNNIHGNDVNLTACNFIDNYSLGADHLYTSFIVKNQYTRFIYQFIHKGKQFTLFGQCSHQYSNECDEISDMTDALASSLSE